MRSVLLCGLPFSGKTTLAGALQDRWGYLRVSPGGLLRARGIEPGQGVSDEEWEDVYTRALATTAEHGPTRPVVFDDASGRRAQRERFAETLNLVAVPWVLIVVRPPLHEVHHRREQAAVMGTRLPVADRVFLDTLARFEWPGSSEPHLTWDGRLEAEDWLARVQGELE